MSDRAVASDLNSFLLARYRSGPPFLFMTVSAAFLSRAAAGVLLSYGDRSATWVSALSACFYAFAALRRLFPGRARREESSLSPNVRIVPRRALLILPVLPFAIASILSLMDAAAGSGALFPWSALLLSAAFFNQLASSFVLAALPVLACGAAAAGAFGGPPSAERAFALAASIPIAAGVFLANRVEALRAFRDCADRIERTRSSSALHDAEVEIAARIQRALLLEAPSPSQRGLRLEAITVASNAVDGDLYGFLPYSNESVDVLIGDVMGKGVPAALLGAALKNAFLRSSLRLLVERRGALPRLDELVASVHDAVAGELSSLESFATLQYARVDSRNLRLDFVDCGHTPILHYDSTMGVTWALKGTDLPLGFSEIGAYASYAVPLAVGDRLVLYSDGITEAPNEAGEQFGDERLASLVGANASLAPSELVRRILNSAMYFSATAGFRDDVTCIVFSVDLSSSAPRRSVRSFPSSLASVADIRGFVEAELADEAAELKARVSLAVSEASSNVVIHGVRSEDRNSGANDAAAPESAACLPGADGSEPEVSVSPYSGDQLRIECLRADEWVSVRMIYQGVPFAWHLPASEPDLETLPEGGFGRALMAKASDSVIYANGGGLQMVCLFFDAGESAGL